MDNLKDKPEYTDQVIKLVEKSFSYPKNFSFQKDFAPLFIKTNLEHLYFLRDGEKVIATALCSKRDLCYRDKYFPTLFIGGISVHESYRSKGLSRQMFTFLEDQYKDVLFFILWSELQEFYQKLGFVEMGVIYEYENLDRNAIFESLPKDYEEKFNNLSHDLIIPFRDQQLWQSWREHKTITKEGSSLKDKGYDLQEVCHEFYPLKLFPKTSAKKVWSPVEFEEKELFSLRFLGLFKVISEDRFKEFIEWISQEQLQIKSFYQDSLELDFKQQSFKLNLSDFLRGLWGPDFILEFENLAPKIYISGFDSI